MATDSGNITIRDVAAKAGVSVATVSRVLNRKGPIREATYQKVIEVAEAMKFVPHAAARSLSMRSTETVGVVLPELYGEFFSEVIRGVDVAARQHGYHIILSGSHSDRGEMLAVLQAVHGRVDGLIIMSPDLTPSTLVRDLPPTLPILVLNATIPGGPSITIDNAGGARAVVRHLTSLGHERIAFIGGPAKNGDAQQRRRGYVEGMHAAGIGDVEALLLDGDFSEDSGYAAAMELARMTPRPTAVFAANDAMAIGAVRALREMSIAVPDDVALVGFDDIPIARFVTPALTTVSVDIAELGRRAFELLLGVIANERDYRNRREKLATRLVIRESCGSHLRTPGTDSQPYRGGDKP